MKVTQSSSLTLFETLWTVACQTPLPMVFSRQEYWSGLPCRPPGDLPNPGIDPESLMSPAVGEEFFTNSTKSRGIFGVGWKAGPGISRNV